MRGPTSEWQADEPVNGNVLWRHPSGAEKLLASTCTAGARRNALCRALKAYQQPAAAESARQSNALAMAQKRADDPVWRERERDANAEAMATRRATDSEWREAERQADAQAKAFEAARPQREAAERGARAACDAEREAEQEKAKRRQRQILQTELMDAAGISSQRYSIAAGLSSQPQVAYRGLVELLSRVWVCKWPVCVFGAPADLQMVEALDLDDAEYVMNLADNCCEYAEFVKALSENGAEWTADESDRVWNVRAHSVADSDRQRFVGLTAAEARSLEAACIAWTDENVDGDAEEWVRQPIPKPPKQHRHAYEDECDCWGCRWVRKSPCAEAESEREGLVRRAEAALRAAEAAAAAPPRPDFATAQAEGRRALKRRYEEALAAMPPTARALFHARDAQIGSFADMTEAERRETMRRPPVLKRIMAFARERRVRNLTMRLDAERAEA